MDFKEKLKEYSPKHGKDLLVWQSPKYKESKTAAENIISSGKYGVTESDFWILMNATKNEQMAYTGLIISHNGCLKINDQLDSKFKPGCVSIDKEGYNGSLVYTYCCPEQGIYEVGEVSKANCKNEYPYAMAYKRLFDRVVLKLSKLAYSGVYSDSEADEFAQRFETTQTKPGGDPKTKHEETADPAKIEGIDAIDWLNKRRVDAVQTDLSGCFCEECGAEIVPYPGADGKMVSVKKHIAGSQEKFNRILCVECIKKKL